MIDEKLPTIRQWADVQKLIDSNNLTPAELRLIAAAKAGEVAQIGDTVPKTKTPETLIRAPLLRYLILGGCKHGGPRRQGCRCRAHGSQASLSSVLQRRKGRCF